MTKLIEKIVEVIQSDNQQPIAIRVRKTGKWSIVISSIYFLLKHDLFLFKSIKIPYIEFNSYNREDILNLLLLLNLYFLFHYLLLSTYYFLREYKTQLMKLQINDFESKKDEYHQKFSDIFDEITASIEIRQLNMERETEIFDYEKNKKLQDNLHSSVKHLVQRNIFDLSLNHRLSSQILIFMIMLSDIVQLILPVCIFSISYFV